MKKYYAIKVSENEYLSFEFDGDEYGYWVEKEKLCATNGKYILFEDLQDAFNLWGNFSKGLNEPINEFGCVTKEEFKYSKLVEIEAELKYKEINVFE